MTPKKRSHVPNAFWRIAISLLLIGVGVYALGSHWQKVSNGFQVAHHAQAAWLVLAVVLTAVTFCLAAAVYRVLALRPIRYGQTVLVELAASFVNRLLPAGLGGLGLHGLYLHRKKHSVAQATAVVSINNLLGISAHLSLLLVLLIVRPETIHSFKLGGNTFSWKWLGAGVVVLLLVLCVPTVRTKLHAFAKNLLASLRMLRPNQTLRAFSFALLLTTTYTFVLYSVCRGLGLSLDFLQVFVVFSVGMLLGTVTPTPGGLVGVEAGLYSGFMAYSVPTGPALAAVLLFRLCTYWLPLLPGLAALLIARRRHLL